MPQGAPPGEWEYIGTLIDTQTNSTSFGQNYRPENIPAGSPQPTSGGDAQPDTIIDGGPLGATNSATAAFRFSSDASHSTFECKLDYPGSPGDFVQCSSPASYSSLADGAYTFSVRAVDEAGHIDTTPAESYFSVDTAAPDTQITSGPSGPCN